MKDKTITDALAKSLKQIMKAWKKDSKIAVYKAEYIHC